MSIVPSIIFFSEHSNLTGHLLYEITMRPHQQQYTPNTAIYSYSGRNSSVLSVLLLFLLSFCIQSNLVTSDQIPCVWDHNPTGTTFDLRALTKSDYYFIRDGDDPCTVEEEKAYDFYFNICDQVKGDGVPSSCDPNGSLQGDGYGAGIQYDPDSKECKVIGEYLYTLDEYMFSRYDNSDPSKGVTLKLEGNPKSKCHHGGMTRSLTIDVICADKMQPVIDFMREPEHCQYHASIRSVHGCPKECPTTGNGLCDGHGHCAWDGTNSKAHCYCNQGHRGADCSETFNVDAKANQIAGVPTSNYGTQIGLLGTLLAVVIVLVSGVIFMVYQVYKFRKEGRQKYNSFQGELSRMGTGTDY